MLQKTNDRTSGEALQFSQRKKVPLVRNQVSSVGDDRKKN